MALIATQWPRQFLPRLRIAAALLIGVGACGACPAADPGLRSGDEQSTVVQTEAAAESDPVARQLGGQETGGQEIGDYIDQFDLPRRPVPQLVGGRFQLPPLGVETTATDEVGNGRLPDSFREESPIVYQPLPESAGARVPTWNWSIAEWAAPETFSYPLYFEDRMLERHGHLRFGHLQPAAAATRFVGSAIMLPYLATIDPPCDCDYTLGYLRSGSCAPPLLQRPPYECRAAIAEAVWLGGAIAIFP